MKGTIYPLFSPPGTDGVGIAEIVCRELREIYPSLCTGLQCDDLVASENCVHDVLAAEFNDETDLVDLVSSL